MEKKSNIRKVITVAAFVLIFIAAVYFYFSAPDVTDSSGEQYNSDYLQTSQSSQVVSDVESAESTGNVDSTTSVENSEQSEPISSTQNEQSSQTSTSSQSEPVVASDLKFRSNKLLQQHYEKHGIEMGFSSAEEYEQAAAAVPYHPDVLHKTEKEDGDDVYYIEATNEFVVVSGDGYLRTYFLPSAGKSYYDRQ